MTEWSAIHSARVAGLGSCEVEEWSEFASRGIMLEPSTLEVAPDS